MWTDTHCHLDAPEFGGDAAAVRSRAASQGVDLCVIPAVQASHFGAVMALAHRTRDACALGIHPLYVPSAEVRDLDHLDDVLTLHRDDPHLVAVGEIGLDFFVPALCTPEMRAKQEHFYRAQLQLARKHGLPVVLHVRRSADRLLKHLREVAGPHGRWQGIVHAFNGSLQQAEAFVALGFKLGFGGAVTFERATQLRQLAQSLPLSALVLETDAPDIPPHWMYTPAAQRAQGIPQGRNEPAQLVGIAEVVAQLRGITLAELAKATTYNVQHAFPRWNLPLVEING